MALLRGACISLPPPSPYARQDLAIMALVARGAYLRLELGVGGGPLLRNFRELRFRLDDELRGYPRLPAKV